MKNVETNHVKAGGEPVSRGALARQYASTLAQYLNGGGEETLRHAYEAGREALAGRASLLDLAAVHHMALAEVIPRLLPQRDLRDILRAAGEFHAETLSSFEMVYRGVRDANAALRHFNDVLEAEARRIAHLLHDEAGQLLFAVQLSLAEMAQDADPVLQARLQNVNKLIDQVEERMRSLSHELRPTILDDLGLIPALEQLARGVSMRTGIDVRVHALPFKRVDPRLETILYRVVQEALNNVAKHSQATETVVDLKPVGDKLCCIVRDNGVGLVQSKKDGTEGRGGLGLVGIRERLNAVNGTLEIRSLPGQGTEVEIKVSIEV